MNLASGYREERADDERRYDRRLAAIVSIDVAGYSRLMAIDESDTMAALDWTRALIEQAVARHNGRLVNSAGDGFLLEFGSAVTAVQCASELQDGMQVVNRERAAGRRMLLRIGINVGDVILRDGDLFGDGVNIAARVQALAEPGGIAITATVHDQIVHKLNVHCEDDGAHAVKNIVDPVQIYHLRPATARAFWRRGGRARRRSGAISMQMSPYPRLKVLTMGLVLGVFGAHRFTVKRKASGLLQAVTLGGLGLWWLYDMVELISGDFIDNAGRPVRHWLA